METRGPLALFPVLISLIKAVTTTTYTFERDSCLVIIQYIKDEAVFVTYNGGRYRTYCNKMSFYGHDKDNILDEYKLCVTPEYFEDPDCAISLEYKSTSEGNAEQNYTCVNHPSEWCGNDDGYLYIYLHSLETNTSNAKFQLKLEAHMTLNYYARVGMIAGIVCGAAAIISLIFGIIVYVKCKRRKGYSGHISTNPQPNPVQLRQDNTEKLKPLEEEVALH